MKKYVLILLILLILFSFCACSKEEQIKEPTYNTNMEYSGFSDIPDNYTPEEAKKDNCFVIVSDDEGNTELDVYGESQWHSFYESSNKGEDVFLRVAHFIDNEGYYTDLYYSEDKYYYYTKDEFGIRLQGPFNYLRALFGMDGIPKKEVTLYVLTDSTDLTYNDVTWSFLSSNLESITKIPFVWLGFTTYLDDIADISSIPKDEMIAMVESITQVPVSTICSSNPYDYIDANIDTYNTLVALGQPAVDCFLEELRTTESFGIDKYIMATVCSEITGFGAKKNMADEYDSSTWWASADEWLALYEESLEER